MSKGYLKKERRGKGALRVNLEKGGLPAKNKLSTLHGDGLLQILANLERATS